jgi:hypothetical protein
MSGRWLLIKRGAGFARRGRWPPDGDHRCWVCGISCAAVVLAGSKRKQEIQNNTDYTD